MANIPAELFTFTLEDEESELLLLLTLEHVYCTPRTHRG